MTLIECNAIDLQEKCISILQYVGIKRGDAALVIDSLLDAEKRGIQSHGIMRLESYVNRIERGLINPSPKIELVENTGPLLLIDGDHGLGQVVANKVLDICMNHSEKFGITAATVRNSNHFGASGFYTRKAALHGFYSQVSSNAGPTMAPWGGTKALLGTNPISISFPAGKFKEFTMDIAVSATAKGKIRYYEKENKEIPLGWALDEDGNETTDPKKAIEGTVLPMGGHKGYGFAMAMDILCGGINDGKFSYEAESVTKTTKKSGVGHFFLTIKIDNLIPIDSFESRVEDWFHMLKSSTTKEGISEIMIPGEIENRRVKNNNNHFTIQKKVLQKIEELYKHHCI